MPKFKLYKAKLRLSGSVLNEVPLTDVTAAEIDILRAFHGGDDAVVAVKESGSVERGHAEERARLYEKFAGADIEGQQKKKLAAIRDLFGSDRNPLPLALDADEEEVEAAPTRRQRTSRASAEAASALE